MPECRQAGRDHWGRGLPDSINARNRLRGQVQCFSFDGVPGRGMPLAAPILIGP